MGMFSMSTTAGAKESGKVLTSGIHNAKFKGISKEVQEKKDGSSSNVMKLTLDIEGYGEWSHMFWEPTSNERPDGPYGKNPSQADNFLISVREILEALNPEFGEKIDKGELKELEAPNFGKFVLAVKNLTDDYIDTDVQIKLLPQPNGFNGITPFPARLKGDVLMIRTKFIGQNLTLSDTEVKAIENARNATPTNMAGNATKNDLADKLGEDLLGEDVPEDDLPF